METLFSPAVEKLLAALTVVTATVSILITPWPTVDEILGIPNPEEATELLRSMRANAYDSKQDK